MIVRIVLKLRVPMFILMIGFPELAQASTYEKCRWKKERPHREGRWRSLTTILRQSL